MGVRRLGEIPLSHAVNDVSGKFLSHVGRLRCAVNDLPVSTIVSEVGLDEGHIGAVVVEGLDEKGPAQLRQLPEKVRVHGGRARLASLSGLSLVHLFVPHHDVLLVL